MKAQATLNDGRTVDRVAVAPSQIDDVWALRPDWSKRHLRYIECAPERSNRMTPP